MRSIWRVIAAITPMRRPHAFNGGTVVKHWKIPLQYDSVTSFDDVYYHSTARGRRIVVHSLSGKLRVGLNASTARRPCRPQCVSRNAADYEPTLTRKK